MGCLCPVEFLCRKLRLRPTEALRCLADVRKYCQGCIDLRFKAKRGSTTDSCVNRNIRKQAAKPGAAFNRTTPIYDNTILLTPDGEMLSRLSRKKAEWYLKRELGVCVSEDPLVVQLLFEPSGRASCQNDYYVQEKENMCAVCGSRDGCVKKNIIPVEYRRYGLWRIALFTRFGAWSF